MRSWIVFVALTAVLHAGCFTVLGATVGGISDSGSKHAPPPPPAPVQVTGAPGATALIFERSHRKLAPANEGMSGAAKGALVGVTIDAVLTGLLILAVSEMDWEWCGDTDSGCSD